jgi:SagB-type dehydrogenase family enzyme
MRLRKKIPSLALTLSQQFHEQTKIKKIPHELPMEKWPDSWKKVTFKGYPRFSALRLSKPKKISVKFSEVLDKRKSTRKYSPIALDEPKLSSLLYHVAGIREKNEFMQANRFYPSAGARYPLEVYPLVFNVKGIKSGIYHYYVKNHLLEYLPTPVDFQTKALNYFSNTDWTKNTAVIFIISAVFFRNQVKYGERGYRHILTELGSILQNVYLVSSALNLGCCPTGGYMDDKFNSLLDLDGVEESVIGAIAIGNVDI